jgi:hypothetical protein
MIHRCKIIKKFPLSSTFTHFFTPLYINVDNFLHNQHKPLQNKYLQAIKKTVKNTPSI